jgi:hypothetical protein
MNPDDLKQLLNHIDLLEKRITLLESRTLHDVKVQPILKVETESENMEFSDLNISISNPFETNFGEYGLAWLGNIVLFFAIAFLWKYFNDAGKPLISAIVGVISVAGFFTLSHYFRRNFSFLSFMFNLFGFVILFYIGLKLHYYNDKPLITNQVIATSIILLIIVGQLFFAFKNKSQILAGMAFIFASITAFASGSTHSFYLISLLTTVLVMYSFWKYNWWKALVIVLCIGFLTNVIWMLKNPVSLIKSPDDLTYQFAFVYYSIITAIYSLVVFRKPEKAFSSDLILSVIMLAGISYSAFLLILVVKHFPDNFVPFFTLISIYCITFSVILKLYSPWKYTPALFALFGFVAISVTVFGIYHLPDSFLLLTIQSIMVLAMALWYRSQIIAVMNTFLLISLILAYYKISGTLQAVNFSIPIVAFISARIINWQKKRMNIKTDFLRNMNLFILFFSLLYATYKGLPGQYIALSWLGITGMYFIFSIVLRSIKYRWLAMSNLMVTAFYLFLIDLAKIDLIFRILAFLVFAVISIIISTYYVKKLKKNSNDQYAEETVNPNSN